MLLPPDQQQLEMSNEASVKSHLKRGKIYIKSHVIVRLNTIIYLLSRSGVLFAVKLKYPYVLIDLFCIPKILEFLASLANIVPPPIDPVLIMQQ